MVFSSHDLGETSKDGGQKTPPGSLSHDRRTFGFLLFLVVPLKSLPPRGKVSFRGRGGLWRGGRLSERLDGCMCRKRLGAASRHGGQRVVRCVRQGRRDTEMEECRGFPVGPPLEGCVSRGRCGVD